MHVPKHTIGSANRDRATWAQDEARFAVVREAVEQGQLIEPAIRLNPSAHLDEFQREWLAEAERGVERLRGEGLSPRVGLPFRTDIITGPVVSDFPFSIVLPVEDVADHALRFTRQSQAIHAFPNVDEGLGSLQPLSGVLEACVKEHGRMPVTYWGDSGRRRSILAVLLNTEHPLYLPWLVVAAQRLLQTIQEDYPGLEGLELVLTAKDKHYHRLEDGSLLWPLLGEENEAGQSSGLSAPPSKLDPIEARVRTLQALRLAGVPCIPDVWMTPEHRHEYVNAFGGEWTQ